MKGLKDILYKVQLLATSGNPDVEVAGITMDSRQVQKDFAFVAIMGSIIDGHAFILKAIENGASVIICEEMPEKLAGGISYVQVKDASKALGIMASNFYDNPSSRLQLVAITGTNGKTTIVTLLYQLFQQLGYKVGMLSTVVNRIDGKDFPSRLTTPDAIETNRLLAEMVKAGCAYCFMEASSHAIVQERISGLTFKGAVFTNITHDHLDYHQTFDNYIKAKKKLFDELPKTAFALVNADDKRGQVMLQNCKASKHTYGIHFPADYKAKILTNSLQGLELDIDNKQVWFRLIGDFNASNLMAVFGVADLLGEDEEEALMALSQADPASGRFQQVANNAGITAIVDYAHTPDALENVLDTIKSVRTGQEQVITVVGCGGNRDKSKRPLMAQIACKFSDKVVLTSDNPRDEDPDQILQEMYDGVSVTNRRKVLTISDRKAGIKTACTLANKGDIILVAGKGHETYQEIKGERFPFDDREIVKEFLEMLHEKQG
ncbi:UDP-N-acetylmuramoyl-L-alanyl-D-glutamate--2,6-diaminopimelate ligase [Fulvivirgaceae bacterium LMO-SS25]